MGGVEGKVRIDCTYARKPRSHEDVEYFLGLLSTRYSDFCSGSIQFKICSANEV